MEKFFETFNARCLAAFLAARFALSVAAIVLAGTCFVYGALEGTRALRNVRQAFALQLLEYELGHYDTRLEDGNLKSTADLTDPIELKRQLLASVSKMSSCKDALVEINALTE